MITSKGFNELRETVRYLDQVPFDVSRKTLYTAAELYEGFDPDSLPAREYQLISGTVSSLRIDSVTALAIRSSRSNAMDIRALRYAGYVRQGCRASSESPAK